MKRRTFMVAGGGMLLAGSAYAATNKIGASSRTTEKDLHDAIARIEASSGGRLGIALHDTGSGNRFVYRANEEFKMMSTVKLLLAAAALKLSEQGKVRLDRLLPLEREDAMGWSPFTERRAGTLATVLELCRAMTVESDGGAAKLVLAEIGGVAALARFLREIGDDQTLAALQTNSLNGLGDEEVLWQAELATTTPLVMQSNAERLWLGTALAPANRAQLLDWAVACQTGHSRLRAGLPAGWRGRQQDGDRKRRCRQ